MKLFALIVIFAMASVVYGSMMGAAMEAAEYESSVQHY